MLPNLSLLPLETNVKLVKPEKAEEKDQLPKAIEKKQRQEIVRKRRVQARELALKTLSKEPALPSISGSTFYSNNPDDRSIVALILYTRGWDQYINSFLMQDFEGWPYSQMNWLNDTQTSWQYARVAITMFMNVEDFYDKFVVPYTSLPHVTSWYFSDGHYAYFKATLTDTCVFGDLETISPGQGFDQGRFHSYVQSEMEYLGLHLIRRLNKGIKNGDNNKSTTITFGAFAHMTEALERLFRPWYYFYQYEHTVDDELAKLYGKGSSSRYKQDTRRIDDGNKYVSDCAAVGIGDVLWFGLGEPIDLHRLSTAYRSASLSPKVALKFTSPISPGIFGLLLDPNVPVISVLGVLGQSPKAVCFPGECEFLISQHCTYEFVAETKEERKSFEAQMDIIKNTHPEQHKSIMNSSIVEEMKKLTVLTFLSVKFDEGALVS